MTAHELHRRALDRLAELRAQDAAATPGPWETECIGSEGWHVFGPRGLDERLPQRRPRVSAVTWGSFDSDKADAALIAIMRNAWPLVLDGIEARLRVHRPYEGPNDYIGCLGKACMPTPSRTAPWPCDVIRADLAVLDINPKETP